MSMEYLSIYLYLLQSLSSISWSFQCTGLLPPWLNLFLGILFFFFFFLRKTGGALIFCQEVTNVSLSILLCFLQH